MSDQRPRSNTQITADQVTQAIVQLMRGPSGDGAVDNALASTLAGQVLPVVQKQFAGKSSSELGTEPAFRSLVSLHIATAQQTDPNVVRLAAMRHNITSADHSAAERAGLHGGSAHGRFAAFVTGVSVEGRGMPGLAATNGNLTVEQARDMAAARTLATQLGMPWAANHPDLLKLGPAAIKALHDVGVQRERFERMTGDKVGFKAETAVAIARFAKRHNLTPEQTNRLYDDVSKGAEIVSGGDKHIQRELDQATREFANGPNTPEAREKLQKAWGRHAKTPEQQAAAQQATQALIEAAKKTTELKTTATAEQNATAAEKEKAATAAQDNMGGLDDDLPVPPAKKPDAPAAPQSKRPDEPPANPPAAAAGAAPAKGAPPKGPAPGK